MNETLAADLNASTRKAPNFQPSAALARPVPVPLTPFLSPPEYPWSDSERCVTNALLGLFANFRLSIRIPSLAVWSKAGTNVRKWLRLLRSSFSSPYEVCFMEKKKSKWGWRASWKKDVGIDFWLENNILEIPTPSRLLWFTVSTATTSTKLWAFSAHSRFPPFTARASAAFLVAVWPFYKGFGNAVSSLCFSSQDPKKKKKKYWVCNSDAGTLKFVISAPLSCTWPVAHLQPFQSYRSA